MKKQVTKIMQCNSIHIKCMFLYMHIHMVKLKEESKKTITVMKGQWLPLGNSSDCNRQGILMEFWGPNNVIFLDLSSSDYMVSS